MRFILSSRIVRSLVLGVAAILLLAGEKDRQTLKEACDLFEKSFERHNAKQYSEAVAGFEKIVAQYPTLDLSARAAYNVACGYAQLGKNSEALSWLERSVRGGFLDIEQIRGDAELAGIRGEKRYSALLAEASSVLSDWDVNKDGKGTVDDAVVHLENHLKRHLESIEAPKRSAMLAFLKKLEAATVLVLVESGGGSGVFVKTAKGKYLVTAGHVVDGMKAPRVRLPDGRTFPLTVLKMSNDGNSIFDFSRFNDDATPDIAVCAIGGFVPSDDQCVRPAKKVVNGETAYVVGYPGLYGRTTGGNIGDLKNAFAGAKALTALTNMGIVFPMKNYTVFRGDADGRIAVPPFPGNSGGPVFNADGELIGILAAGFPKAYYVPQGGCTGLAVITSFLNDVERKK